MRSSRGSRGRILPGAPGQSVLGPSLVCRGASRRTVDSVAHARSKVRGRGKGSIYWDEAKGRYARAVILGYSPSGTRIRKKAMGRTKTEVREKLRELHVTELLPDPSRLRLMARVSTGAAAPMNRLERRMLDAVPHRHTHRGPFGPGPLPHGLLAGLQHDALAEGATLTLVTGGLAYDRLEQIAAAAARRQGADPRTRAEIRRWTRIAADTARDGIPVTALASSTDRPAGRLPQRDFDLGRGITRLPSGGAPPAATAVLLTPGDRRTDWLRAGQALYRLLLHAASQGVFASLYTQPLEDAVTRNLISSRLALLGRPQVLLQLGPATTASPTARRLPREPDSP